MFRPLLQKIRLFRKTNRAGKNLQLFNLQIGTTNHLAFPRKFPKPKYPQTMDGLLPILFLPLLPLQMHGKLPRLSLRNIQNHLRKTRPGARLRQKSRRQFHPHK